MCRSFSVSPAGQFSPNGFRIADRYVSSDPSSDGFGGHPEIRNPVPDITHCRGSRYPVGEFDPSGPGVHVPAEAWGVNPLVLPAQRRLSGGRRPGNRTRGSFSGPGPPICLSGRSFRQVPCIGGKPDVTQKNSSASNFSPGFTLFGGERRENSPSEAMCLLPPPGTSCGGSPRPPPLRAPRRTDEDLRGAGREGLNPFPHVVRAL